jgi:CHAD domain-containing protein
MSHASSLFVAEAAPCYFRWLATRMSSSIRPLFPDRPTGLLKERIRILFRHFPKAMAGEEEPIHQMRVAARRLRVALPLLAKKRRGRRVRKALAILRSVTRTGGRSRDLDVGLALLEDRLSAAEEPNKELRDLRSRLRSARRRSRSPMAEGLLDLPISRLRERLAEIVASRGADVFTVMGRVHETAHKELRRSAATLEALGDRFDPAELHRLRIRARRLRYVAEVSDAIRGQTSGAPALLKRFQERLGRIHDAAVLGEWMGRQADLAERRNSLVLAREARRQQQLLIEEARRHHAAFLAEGPVGVLDRAIGAFLPGRTDAQAS